MSWDINLCSFSKDVRTLSLKEIMKSIDIAARIEAEILVVHPGKMSFERAERELFLNILCESFMKIQDYSSNKKIRIYIENMELV